MLFSCSVVSNSLQPQGLQHARHPCPSVSSRVCSNSYPLSQWCHPTISSSVVPFSSSQSFSASGSFPMSQLFASGGQGTWTSASASALPINIQGWFPLGLTGLTFLLSKGLSRVFSSIMVIIATLNRVLVFSYPEKHLFTILYNPTLWVRSSRWQNEA